MDNAELSQNLDAILRHTLAGLLAAGVHDEALAILKPARSILGIKTAASMKSAGRAWRLGALLIDEGCRLFNVGQVTRAIEPGRAAVNRSAAGEQRRADRLTASRGPFPRGEVVNFGHVPIAMDAASIRSGSGPLSLVGDMIMFESAATGTVPLESYLADRLQAATPE
jgi:hypothetical protein